MSKAPVRADEVAFPLRAGDAGAAVVDLQARLADLGFPSADPLGAFGTATEAAVRAFQSERGLPGDGECDPQTWSAVVEAGFRLGSRLLYRRVPMMRGDDVADLQARLSRLGFDPGRIDGIFGDRTVSALTDFQRNVGLHADGILGWRSFSELDRLSLRDGASGLVTPLRERLAIVDSGPSDLRGRRFAVVEAGGALVVASAICRALRAEGVVAALSYSHRDPSRRAAVANDAGVDCLISLDLVERATGNCRTIYYRGFRYESLASHHLAELLQEGVPRALGLDDGGTAGMALPVLRETSMPAVELVLGPPERVVPHAVELGRAVVAACSRWVADESG